MRNSIAEGRRYAAGMIALQVAATVLLALSWAAAHGARGALAAAIGGGVVAVGNATLALRMFGAPARTPRQALRATYVGEVLKLALVAGVIVVALVVLRLPPLPLIVGLGLAQMVFWLGLVAIR